MDLPQDEMAAVESRSPSNASESLGSSTLSETGVTGPCGFPGCAMEEIREAYALSQYTFCSTEGCTGWCHYEDCFTRFCDASEFYPGLDTTNPSRDGLMITYCYECALTRRSEYRSPEAEEARARLFYGEDYHRYYYTDSDSQATQNMNDIDDVDSQATQPYESDMDEAPDTPDVAPQA
jgi:hypothetical protein